MRWQLPLILAYSITTHKSQSMTAHNGIVYESSKQKPFARGLPSLGKLATLKVCRFMSVLTPLVD